MPQRCNSVSKSGEFWEGVWRDGLAGYNGKSLIGGGGLNWPKRCQCREWELLCNSTILYTISTLFTVYVLKFLQILVLEYISNPHLTPPGLMQLEKPRLYTDMAVFFFWSFRILSPRKLKLNWIDLDETCRPCRLFVGTAVVVPTCGAENRNISVMLHASFSPLSFIDLTKLAWCLFNRSAIAGLRLQ